MKFCKRVAYYIIGIPANLIEKVCFGRPFLLYLEWFAPKKCLVFRHYSSFSQKYVLFS